MVDRKVAALRLTVVLEVQEAVQVLTLLLRRLEQQTKGTTAVGEVRHLHVVMEEEALALLVVILTVQLLEMAALVLQFPHGQPLRVLVLATITQEAVVAVVILVREQAREALVVEVTEVTTAAVTGMQELQTQVAVVVAEHRMVLTMVALVVQVL
jgi:hypothetical protein